MINAPSIFVIFGVTGDLAAKKIIPALWHLFRHHRLPDRLSIIGFSRSDLSRNEFKMLMRETLMGRSESDIPEDDFLRFFRMFSYQSGMFEDKNAFRSLSGKIVAIESSWGGVRK